MRYLSAIILLLLWLINIKIEKKKITIGFVFFLSWSLFVVLSIFQLYGMYNVSNTAYFIVFFGCLNFAVLYWLTHYFTYIKPVKIKGLTGVVKLGVKNYQVNYFVVYPLAVLVTLFYSYIAIQAIQVLLNGGNVLIIRNMIGSYDGVTDTFFDAPWKKAINNRIATPYLHAIIPITLSTIFERKNNWLLTITTVMNVIMYTLFTQSRFILIYIIIDVIILISHYKISIPDKIVKWFKRIVFVLLLAIVLMTVLRRMQLDSKTSVFEMIFKTTYQYFTLCLPLMSHWIDEIIQNNHMTYGAASLQGVIEFVMLFLRRVGVSYPDLYNYASSIVQETQTNFIVVYSGKAYNAFVTMFYYFFLDFRYLGIIIGCGFIGWITKLFEYKTTMYQNLYNISIYLLLAQCVVKSFVRFEGAMLIYIMAFIYLRIMLINKGWNNITNN